jgi:hypothetical protein
MYVCKKCISMNVHMCVCAYVQTCEFVQVACVCVSVRKSVCVRVPVHVHMCVHVCLHLCVSICVRMCACVFACA